MLSPNIVQHVLRSAATWDTSLRAAQRMESSRGSQQGRGQTPRTLCRVISQALHQRPSDVTPSGQQGLYLQVRRSRSWRILCFYGRFRYGGFKKWGYSQIGPHGRFIRENPMKMDDLGVPLSEETSIYQIYLKFMW